MSSPSPQSTDRRRSGRPPADSTLRNRLGPYRLCLKIGEGGMASIYLARTASGHVSRRPLAVKVIHPHLATDHAFVDMFLDEAEIASRIHHVNVCSVVDYAADGDGHYIAMEYIVGESLMALWRELSRRPTETIDLRARRIAHMLSGLCEGLHAAHELRDPDGELLHVVHRDVSPENVFLSYDGTVKVVDFGVASALHKRHQTRTGIVKGKFAYVAPEMLRGAKPDRRVDIWSVGVIAWELATGRRLFRKETDVDTLHAVTEGEIVPPSQVVDGLPPELDAIVMRALRRDPDERYATARELGQELAAFAAASPSVVGAGDLGRWLEEVFPGGRARHQHLIDLSAQLDSEGAATPSIEVSIDEDPAPRTRALGLAPPEVPEALAAVDSGLLVAPRPATGRTRARMIRIIALVAACTALGLAAGVAIGQVGGARAWQGAAALSHDEPGVDPRGVQIIEATPIAHARFEADPAPIAVPNSAREIVIRVLIESPEPELQAAPAAPRQPRTPGPAPFRVRADVVGPAA